MEIRIKVATSHQNHLVSPILVVKMPNVKSLQKIKLSASVHRVRLVTLLVPTDVIDQNVSRMMNVPPTRLVWLLDVRMLAWVLVVLTPTVTWRIIIHSVAAELDWKEIPCLDVRNLTDHRSRHKILACQALAV